MPSRSAWSSLLLVLLLVAGGCDRPPSGHVDDRAGLFDAGAHARIETFHALLLADHDIDYQLVTTHGDLPIERQALDAFAEREVGSRSVTGRGLLLLVDARQDRVRLEVAAPLEGVYVDAFVAYLQERQMVPFFTRGRVADGILAATEMIVTRAQNAARDAGFDGEGWAGGATGAGASVAARLGRADGVPSFRGSADIVPAADEPGAVVAAYLDAMQARNANPDLPIYSVATREMLAGWVVTPAQMDNIVAAYRRCHAEAPRIAADRAVIRHPPAQRACAPWFLHREGGRWVLDLTLMQGALRFGRDNAWRLVPGVEHPYRFAFTDWIFDRHGFPRLR